MEKQIILKEKTIEIIDIDNLGRKQTKTIAPESLIKVIESAVHREKRFFNSGLIPPNCLEVKMNEEKTIAFLFVEAMENDIKFFNSMYKVSVPSFIFAVTLNDKGTLASSHIAVALENDMSKITDDTLLYLYPFANTNSVNLGVCWGSVKKPTVRNLRQTKGIPYLFLSAEMNGDWYEGSNTSKLPLRDLLIALDKKDIDIFSILKPAGLTYREFVDMVKS